MPLDIKSIEHEVRRAPSIQKSIMTLIQLMSTAINEVKKNPDQLDALIDRFKNNDDELARAIIANTRMAGEEVDPPADVQIPAQASNPVPQPIEHPSGNREARPEPLATPIHSDINPPTSYPTEERRRALAFARIGTQEHQELGAWKGGEGPLHPEPRRNPADPDAVAEQGPPPTMQPMPASRGLYFNANTELGVGSQPDKPVGTMEETAPPQDKDKDMGGKTWRPDLNALKAKLDNKSQQIPETGENKDDAKQTFDNASDLKADVAPGKEERTNP